MRIIQIVLASSALLATAVVVPRAAAECDYMTFPAPIPDESWDWEQQTGAASFYCNELLACSDEPFDVDECVDWYVAALSSPDEGADDAGTVSVDLNCYDSDDYVEDPEICDPVCGDGVCDGGEDTLSCPEDCGVCSGPLPADDNT